MYYEWIQTHKKTIIFTSIGLFLLIVVWGATTYISRIGKVGVTISAVPRDASVTIDDKEVGNGTHWITPGTYKIAAQKEGFKQRSKTVEASTDKEQNVVALSLTPESDVAKTWAENNADDYKANEAYGAIEARANGDYFRKKYPITDVLPYSDPYYSIAYETRPDNSIVITISTPSPRYRYFAIQKFRELGYNPADYRITFTDFKSPLGNNGGINE